MSYRIILSNTSIFSPVEFTEPQDTGVYYLAAYSYSNGILQSNIERNEYDGMIGKQLNTIRLLGASQEISRVTVNGNSHTDFTRLPSGEIQVKNLRLPMTEPFTIKFE